jgi:hypothetical protein
MSDYDSIILDLALAECAERDYQKYQDDLQERAEATLAEVLRDIDIDGLLNDQKDLEPYGDPLHAAVRILVDKVQEEISQVSKQRAEALRKADEVIKRKTEKHWADRIKKAVEIKHNNPNLSDRKIAWQVMEEELDEKYITDDEEADYLMDTVSETLRKKLGKHPKFKALK